jgi:hypothetical protein
MVVRNRGQKAKDESKPKRDKAKRWPLTGLQIHEEFVFLL